MVDPINKLNELLNEALENKYTWSVFEKKAKAIFKRDDFVFNPNTRELFNNVQNLLRQMHQPTGPTINPSQLQDQAGVSVSKNNSNQFKSVKGVWPDMGDGVPQPNQLPNNNQDIKTLQLYENRQNLNAALRLEAQRLKLRNAPRPTPGRKAPRLDRP